MQGFAREAFWRGIFPCQKGSFGGCFLVNGHVERREGRRSATPALRPSRCRAISLAAADDQGSVVCGGASGHRERCAQDQIHTGRGVKDGMKAEFEHKQRVFDDI